MIAHAHFDSVPQLSIVRTTHNIPEHILLTELLMR